MCDAPGVGLKVHGVYLVKAHKRDEETNIGFRYGVITGDVPLLLQHIIHLVERFRQFLDGLIVRFLRFGKAASVHAIVEVGVHPFVDGVNCLAQFRWVQVQVGIGGKLVEFTIEHPDYFRTFIVDDGFGLRIVENGDRVLAVFVIDRFVHLPDGFTTRKWIRCRIGIVRRKGTTVAHVIRPSCCAIGSFFGSSKEPPSVLIGTWFRLLPDGMNGREANGICQTLESTVQVKMRVRMMYVSKCSFKRLVRRAYQNYLPHHERTMRPRTSCTEGKKEEYVLSVSHVIRRLSAVNHKRYCCATYHTIHISGNAPFRQGIAI